MKTSLAMIQQQNLVAKRSAEKLHLDTCISFFVDVKHVLKIHMNRAEFVVHPKFASTRPAFLFQNSFSGLNLTCQM